MKTRQSLALAAALTVAVVWTSSASAATYLIYIPTNASLGGAAGEVYSVRGFEAHDGLSGASLVDAAMAELGRFMGADMPAVSIEIRGTVADISIVRDRAADPRVTDRLLGAVFYTLQMAGIGDVRVDGTKTLTPTSFSRGALVPVFPLHAALPPRRLASGYVMLGNSILPAATFYQRIASGGGPVRDAVQTVLQTGSTDAKLATLGGLDAIRLKDRVGLLLPVLKDGDPRVRVAVLDKLRDVREVKVLKQLEITVKEDPSPDVKGAAARILVNAGKTAFKKYLLLEKLRSKDEGTVIDAAQELIAAGDRRLAPALAELTTHSSARVRAIGVRALLQFELYPLMDRTIRSQGINRDVASPLAESLTKRGSGANQAAGIAWLLGNGDRAQAVVAANTAGDKRVMGAVDALSDALRRTEPEVREAAAKALGRLRNAAGLEALAGAIRSSSQDEERGMFTAQAIAIVAAQPLDTVIKISESPDVTIRQLAVKSLAEFAKERANPRVLSVLRKHLRDREPAIRQAAVYALARINDPGVVGDLVKLKGDRDPGIREQVAFAMATAQHPEAEGILITYLDDTDNNVKLAAVQAVRERKIMAAFDKLKWMVEYRHTGIRRGVVSAIIALGQPGDPALFDLFQARLYDEDPAIRMMAVDALGQYRNDPRTAPAIGGAVTDQDVRVKMKALEVLSVSTDPNAVEQVIRGLFDSSGEAKQVKMATLDALQKLAARKSVKALQEFILNESDGDVKRRAGEVLDTL